MSLILLYSKFSQSCKKLFSIMEDSGIDFSNIQSCCIDNEKVRNRIKANKQLEISTVPCLLNVFTNGTVEKYEGIHCFNWFTEIVTRNRKQSQPVRRENQVREPQMMRETQARESQREPQGRQKEEGNIQPREMSKEMSRETETTPIEFIQEAPKPKKPRMREIEESTPIDNVVFDETTDRHKNKPPPKRIRNNDAEYEEDDNFFGGEPVETREPYNVIRKQKNNTQQDPHGTAAKAKQLAQAREEIESSINPVSQRPMDARRT